MVSIVSGHGTGLFNTSRDLLGAAGELGRAQYGRNGERVTINAANGNLVIQDGDEHLVGLGQNLDVLRTYNSLAAWDGDNGDGWRIGYYRRVQFDAAANVVKRIESDGGESTYAAIGNGQYRSTDGAGQFDVVSFDATTRTWTWVDGDTGSSETYRESAVNDGNFLLREIRDAEGHTTTIGYSGSLISRIARGDEWIDLTYEAGSSRIHQLETHYTDAGQNRTRTLTTYDYQSNRLSKVTTDLTPDRTDDSSTYWTSYGYDSAGRLNSITQADGSAQSIRYDDSTGRVSKFIDARGETSLDYNPATRTTTITDPLMLRTFLVYDSANRLKQISGAATGGTALVQRFEYDAVTGGGRRSRW